tara:strand:- start:893 stop:1444 length:552 start_codon:yes stop_codon:yes gene_type:complete
MECSKLLLEWNGTTLLEYATSSLCLPSVSEVVVVLGHQSDHLEIPDSDPRVRYVVNERYEIGRSESIKYGLSHINQLSENILLLGVDQPRTPEIISRIVDSHLSRRSLITSPRFRGKGGHPLMFSGALKEQLATINEDTQGMREIFRRYREKVTNIELQDPMVCLDINTPEQYIQAKEMYRVH